MERENLMMTQLQDGLHLQMLQQRGPPKNGEEENEDQVQEPLKGKLLDTHKAKSSGKSSYMVSSPKLASKQQAIDNTRYGKIVKVQGGHIVRSISRKDRHSKVYTSKGPRDRRFRLSAATAVQFYDIQDRLGCDRPSKAIDWLIEKAKAAIEALEEAPGKEHGCTNTDNAAQPTEQVDLGQQSMHQLQQHSSDNPMNNVSSFSMDAATHSLRCFKEPVLADPHHLSLVNYAEEALNSASSLSDPNAMEMGWFQRLMAWNYNTGDGGEGYTFNSSSVTLQYPFLGQN